MNEHEKKNEQRKGREKKDVIVIEMREAEAGFYRNEKSTTGSNLT